VGSSAHGHGETASGHNAQTAGNGHGVPAKDHSIAGNHGTTKHGSMVQSHADSSRSDHGVPSHGQGEPVASNNHDVVPTNSHQSAMPQPHSVLKGPEFSLGVDDPIHLQFHLAESAPKSGSDLETDPDGHGTEGGHLEAPEGHPVVPDPHEATLIMHSSADGSVDNIHGTDSHTMASEHHAPIHAVTIGSGNDGHQSVQGK
jgi:hypothetical protein